MSEMLEVINKYFISMETSSLNLSGIFKGRNLDRRSQIDPLLFYVAISDGIITLLLSIKCFPPRWENWLNIYSKVLNASLI